MSEPHKYCDDPEYCTCGRCPTLKDVMIKINSMHSDVITVIYERRDPETGKLYAVDHRLSSAQLLHATLPVETLLKALINNMRYEIDARQTKDAYERT